MALSPLPFILIAALSVPQIAASQPTPTPAAAPVHPNQRLEMRVRLLQSLGDGGGPVSPFSGDVLWLSLELQNNGARPVLVPLPTDDWQDRAPADQFFQITVTDAGGRPLPLTRYGRSAQQRKHRKRRKRNEPLPPVTRPSHAYLYPGKTIAYRYPLGLIYDLSVPGRYTVAAQCHVPDLPPLRATSSFVLDLPPTLTPGDPRLPSQPSENAIGFTPEPPPPVTVSPVAPR